MSLYDSLYGANIIPEAKGALKGKTYNPIRGGKVINYARELLDKFIPLKNQSWKNITKIPQPPPTTHINTFSPTHLPGARVDGITLG